MRELVYNLLDKYSSNEGYFVSLNDRLLFNCIMFLGQEYKIWE